MPPKYNETLGLQHCKVYIFDDSVIISGANLSHDYFTNRQDRYFLIENCPKLADFYDNLISNISDFSFDMVSTNEFKIGTNWKIHPYKGKYSDYTKAVEDKMGRFLKSEKILNEVDENFCQAPKSTEDTWIFPSVQMGLFGIDQDRQMTRTLLESGVEKSGLKFGTGYFNPTEEYLHSILHKSKSNIDLLMAHPKGKSYIR